MSVFYPASQKTFSSTWKRHFQQHAAGPGESGAMNLDNKELIIQPWRD
jgi:hypothetical protein